VDRRARDPRDRIARSMPLAPLAATLLTEQGQEERGRKRSTTRRRRRRGSRPPKPLL